MAGDGGAGALGGLLGQGLGGPFAAQCLGQAPQAPPHNPVARYLLDGAARAAVGPAKHLYTSEARAKARDLLIMHLDEQQRADFDERHYFDVMKGERHYRIICNGVISHNVKLLDDAGKVRYSFCCYPADGASIPPEDVWLAQKLNIEAAEAEFLLTAVKNEPMAERMAHQIVQAQIADFHAAVEARERMHAAARRDMQHYRDLAKAEPSKPARGWRLFPWPRRTR